MQTRNSETAFRSTPHCMTGPRECECDGNGEEGLQICSSTIQFIVGMNHWASNTSVCSK